MSAFNRKDHLVDILFLPLDLHTHASVPLIPNPAGAAQHIRCLPCPVSESHALNRTIKYDMFTFHLLLHQLSYAFGLNRHIFHLRFPHFMEFRTQARQLFPHLRILCRQVDQFLHISLFFCDHYAFFIDQFKCHTALSEISLKTVRYDRSW